MPDQRQLATMRRPHLLDGFTARMTVHAPHSSAERVSAVCASQEKMSTDNVRLISRGRSRLR
jgi:hypothetical protein